MKTNGRFVDGGKLSRGGWDVLAKVLAIKIKRMRQTLAVTANRIDVTSARGNDDVSGYAVMAEWEMSVCVEGYDPTFDAVTDWERWEAINAAIGELPAMASECIRRYVGFGCDQQDPVRIAEALNLNRSTVWANIARAKEKLAVSLERYKGAA